MKYDKVVPNPFFKSQISEILKMKNKHDSPESLNFPEGSCFINSGTNGLRLLLRQLNISKRSYIGVTPLICKTVIDSIELEGFKPYFIDIDDSFQMFFDEVKFNSFPIKALILPHLYGSIHAQFELISNWSIETKTPIINDAAQSFGVMHDNKHLFQCGFGGVISFGPGKTSMAAGGALLFSNQPSKNKINSSPYLLNLISAYFLKSRCLEINSKSALFQKIFFTINKYINRLIFVSITKVQYNSLSYYLMNEKDISEKRKINWDVLHNKLNTQYFKIPKYYKQTTKYKFVFYLEQNREITEDFMIKMQLSGVNIARVPILQNKYINEFESQISVYLDSWYKIFEISTEATLPNENFYKIANIMNDYFIRKELNGKTKNNDKRLVISDKLHKLINH